MTVTIEGKMFGFFKKPDFTHKETGETKIGKYVVQIMTEQKQRNDEIKKELLDISIPDELAQKYKSKEGQVVQIKCNYMSETKVTFYGVV